MPSPEQQPQMDPAYDPNADPTTRQVILEPGQFTYGLFKGPDEEERFKRPPEPQPGNEGGGIDDGGKEPPHDVSNLTGLDINVRNTPEDISDYKITPNPSPDQRTPEIPDSVERA